MAKRNKTEASRWPGSELRSNELRTIAARLCRQGWRYEYKAGSKPRLYNPSGRYMTLPLTPSSYGSILSTKSALKRLGADLESVPRRSSFVGESLTSDETDPSFTDSEWRARQANAEDWRQRIAGYVPPPPPPLLTGVASELMARMVEKVVPRDAMGNGNWSLTQARAMLADGYSLQRVIERTGWGRNWFTDTDDLAAG